MTAANVPKATLYWFSGSCWSAPAQLTAREKGYKDDVELEKRLVDLPKGENFSPAFLRISPEGKVPVLVVPYAHTVEEGITTKFKAITGSAAVTDFLDQATIRSSTHQAPSLSPATVQRASAQKELIELVHKDEVDPNLLLLSFRDDKEREAKLGALPGGFLKGRQEALERYAKEVGDSDAKLKAFYEKKIAENGGLLAQYEGKQDSTDFQKTSQQLWSSIGKTLAVLETKFEPNATYLVGDQVSLADLHVGAWLARILAVAGATSASDIPSALQKLEANLPSPDNKVGAKLAKWAEELFARESFKEVYAEGLH
ncbi:hypothetical protein JCM6882_007572 [Rhodosporidiobolus microsporus]